MARAVHRSWKRAAAKGCRTHSVAKEIAITVAVASRPDCVSKGAGAGIHRFANAGQRVEALRIPITVGTGGEYR